MQWLKEKEQALHRKIKVGATQQGGVNSERVDIGMTSLFVKFSVNFTPSQQLSLLMCAIINDGCILNWDVLNKNYSKF